AGNVTGLAGPGNDLQPAPAVKHLGDLEAFRLDEELAGARHLGGRFPVDPGPGPGNIGLRLGR
ncbi:MAG: hypothetical protein IH908_12070, partial [Proteobacteria bacterium]|nr:hypothetical protein [Pseudomonadota bacterium]